MCDEMLIRRIAGIFVLASVILGVTVHAGFFFLTAFVGVNLLQSSFTKWCPLEIVLGRFQVLGCSPSLKPETDRHQH